MKIRVLGSSSEVSYSQHKSLVSKSLRSVAYYFVPWNYTCFFAMGKKRNDISSD